MTGDALARAGDLEVRLAASEAEIAAAQALRYRVFFEVGGAAPDEASRRARRDICPFDQVCDHVLAVDLAAPRSPDGEAPVVGAYRLLRQEKAALGFYSAAEFEVDALVARHPDLRFLELGRSCVAEGYRAKRAIETLWRGVWAYALRHRIDVMFGCASLPGVDADASALAALAALRPVAPEWRVAPAPGVRRVALPAAALPAAARPDLRTLPPLVKGYLRLGADFGAEAVIDEVFGTTDVFVTLRVADISRRYLDYFAPQPIAA